MDSTPGMAGSGRIIGARISIPTPAVLLIMPVPCDLAPTMAIFTRMFPERR
jgi:hypothetical protein